MLQQGTPCCNRAHHVATGHTMLQRSTTGLHHCAWRQMDQAEAELDVLRTKSDEAEIANQARCAAAVAALRRGRCSVAPRPLQRCAAAVAEAVPCCASCNACRTSCTVRHARCAALSGHIVQRAHGTGHAGTWLTPSTSAPGLGSPARNCAGTGLTPTRPHLRQDWAHPAHICARTGARPCPRRPLLPRCCATAAAAQLARLPCLHSG
jgi:hypothetical protein